MAGRGRLGPPGSAVPRPAGVDPCRGPPRPAPRGRAGSARFARPGRRAPRPAPRQPKLSKDAYRRQKTVIEDDLTRLGLRKSHLELALLDPSIAANFVELRRVTSELADVDQALNGAEEAWLLLEERAP